MALVVKNPPANAGDIRDMGSIPGSGRSPGGGYHTPFQCSCLGNPRDWAAWWAAVYGVAQSRTRLEWLSSCVKTVFILIRLKWFTVLFRSTIPSTFLSIPLIFEFDIETPTKKILICLLKKIIVLYSGTICNFALYFPSLPLNVLSYFHNLKNKKKGKK